MLRNQLGRGHFGNRCPEHAETAPGSPEVARRCCARQRKLHEKRVGRKTTELKDTRGHTSPWAGGAADTRPVVV